MKNFFSTFIASMLLLLASGTASAMLIDGTINFTGNADVTHVADGSAVDKIEFASLNVSNVTGAFASVPLGATAYFLPELELSPLVVKKRLWKAGDFRFKLTDVNLNTVIHGFELVQGKGNVRCINSLVATCGYETTQFAWSFSSQTTGPSFSITMVPAPAASALLGLALIGFAFTRRTKKA